MLDVFFFFSSRRRHTRYWRDWSSDVCSSDLIFFEAEPLRALEEDRVADGDGQHDGDGEQRRSEERRVGKECRCRWSPYTEKKKMQTHTPRNATYTKCTKKSATTEVRTC